MEIDEIYQDIILDHYKRPRHSRTLRDDEVLVDEENPLCGDHIRLAASVTAGSVSDVSIDCRGCAICTASASLMAERVCGRSVHDTMRFAHSFIRFMRGEETLGDDVLGDLAALRGVARYPLRVKCATMPWHALIRAIEPQLKDEVQ